MANFFIVTEYFEDLTKNVDILIIYTTRAPHPHKSAYALTHLSLLNNFRGFWM